MRNCWKAEPKERPTFEEICESLNDMFKQEELNAKMQQENS